MPRLGTARRTRWVPGIPFRHPPPGIIRPGVVVAYVPVGPFRQGHCSPWRDGQQPVVALPGYRPEITTGGRIPGDDRPVAEEREQDPPVGRDPDRVDRGPP